MEGEEKFLLLTEKLFIKVAGHPVTMLNLFKRRLLLHALLCAMLAAASKGTAWRQIQGTGNFALYGLNLFAGSEIHLEDRLHQGFSVGMLAAFSNAAML